MGEREGWNLFPRINMNSLLDLVRQGLKARGFLYVTFGNLVYAALGGFFICFVRGY